MMETRLLLDRNEHKIVAYSEQDVEPILDRNKALQNEAQKSDWGRHIANIPNVILMKWYNEEGVDFWRLRGDDLGKFIKKKLNDPDYRYLRTDNKSNPFYLGWR